MKFSNLKLTTPYLELEPPFYTKVEPTPLENPFLISASKNAASLLGIDEDVNLDEKLVEIINGSLKLEGSESFAMCYSGHQFGHFAGRLGDGRAINLGKVNGWNLQVKGAGLTEYSRQGDGRAVLRSSIREYLVSEAMHGLGIATTRALALVGSDSDVARERWEKGALVLRLSPTWVRFGTFEYFNSTGEHSKLQTLADYVIEESFPHLKGVESAYLKMYGEIVRNTALTIAKWQSVGFNHGVMNTDNMSIDGRTIDYGPFAFLDDYKKEYICNHTDQDGQYRFSNQPATAHWNLDRLAVALSPIVNYDEMDEILDDIFRPMLEHEYNKIMRTKLGLEIEDEEDEDLVYQLLRSLEMASIDYTLFFRKLSTYTGDKSPLLDICINRLHLEKWLDMYDLRLEKEEVSIEKYHEKMLAVNPKYILKNHILQEAIDKAQKDNFSIVNELLKVAYSPFDEHEELEYLSRPIPLSSKNIKLSCSS